MDFTAITIAIVGLTSWGAIIGAIIAKALL